MEGKCAGLVWCTSGWQLLSTGAFNHPGAVMLQIYTGGMLQPNRVEEQTPHVFAGRANAVKGRRGVLPDPDPATCGRGILPQ